MNYRNAQDIFPENLLKQIQRYVSGETHNRRAFRKILSFVWFCKAYSLHKTGVHYAEKSNIPFSDGLKLFERYYIGPIKMPTDLFERNTGPEEGMKYKIDKDWWPIHVSALEDSIKKDPDMPPLIAHYVEHGFEMNDGNTRLQAYKNLGVQEVSIIIWITEQEEYEEFMSRYGNYAEGAPVIRR